MKHNAGIILYVGCERPLSMKVPGSGVMPRKVCVRAFVCVCMCVRVHERG